MATAVQTAPIPAHELSHGASQLPKLRSNHGRHLDQDTVGWMRITTPDTPLEEMRRRFNEEGYIFVKNLIPREDVLDVRQAYFEHMAPTKILIPGSDPRQGIFNDAEDPDLHNGNGAADLPEDVNKVDRLVSAHTHPTYLKFLEHPQLRGFVRRFMGWESDVLIKRTLLRHNVPGGSAAGIHYDKIFLRSGEAEFLTAWVPIGDCTASGGGLMYLENSTDVGQAYEQTFTSRAASLPPAERISAFNVNMMRSGHLSQDAAELTEEIEAGEHGGAKQKRRWLVGDYEAGDVVFHNPWMIHCAVKNEDTEGRIRLSTDLRFYEEGTDLDKRWNADVWRPGDGL